MCGIVGAVHLSGAPLTGVLDRCAEVLEHRGPDDWGVWADGPLAVLQTRLSIIGLDSGHQPMESEDGRLVLVANGEIYNHVELREELEAAGCRFRTGSDSEVIIHAYRTYGRGALDRLHGMFAFVLVDRERRAMLVARDRLGIKPLYYRTGAGMLAFGSEPKALLALQGPADDLAPAALCRFLQANYTLGTETLFDGVHRVRPGEAMWVDGSGIRERWRYWSATSATPATLDHEEAAVAFEALFASVMEEHLRSDVPIGIFLSGGVDSSLLLAMVAEHAARPARAFTARFASTSVADESATAAATAARYGVAHEVVDIDADGLFESLPDAVWAADDLSADYANLPTSLLARAARASVKVVLSGEGGDEVFAGYGRYRTRGPKRWRDRWRAPDTRGFRASGLFSANDVGRVFGARLRGQQADWREPIRAAWNEPPASWSELGRMQHTDLVTWLPDDLLTKADRMLMASGVEGRVPYLDHRVVEFGLSLPDELKCGRGGGKRFLRRFAEDRLPAAVTGGRKRGFTVPVDAWLSGERLRRLAEVLPRHPVVEEWLQPSGVRALLAAQARGGGHSSSIWALLNLAVWHEIFFAGAGRRPAQRCDPIELIAAR